MGIVHVELFEFKPLATQEEVQQVSTVAIDASPPDSAAIPNNNNKSNDGLESYMCRTTWKRRCVVKEHQS